MAQENTIFIAFTEAEIQTIKTAISQISSTISGKTKSLTPGERQQYGRVKYEKEVWIDRIKTQMDNNPDKIPDKIDKAEFDKDYAAHKQLNGLITALELQLDLMLDTNLLLGYDLVNSALMFYLAIKVAATNNDPGAHTIYDVLKQQFPGGGKKVATPSTNP